MQLNFDNSVLSSKKFWFICHRYCVMFVVNSKITKNWESQNTWRKLEQRHPRRPRVSSSERNEVNRAEIVAANVFMKS